MLAIFFFFLWNMHLIKWEKYRNMFILEIYAKNENPTEISSSEAIK